MDYKEQVLYFFLQGKISLSQYDYKFMANLQTIIHQKSRVTSNQAALFEKLISKYSKQLTKFELDKETLRSLPWRATVVDSTEQYTCAFVTIVGDEITIRLPFNKAFVSSFRDIAHNTFQWIKEDKLYRAPFSTTAFKIAVTSLYDYFPKVKFCDNTTSLLNQLNLLEASIWDPTLVRMGDSYVVAACNPILADLLRGVDLTPTPRTLFNLLGMGIKTDLALVADDPMLKLSCEYISEVDLDDLSALIEWLKHFSVDHDISFSRAIGLNKSMRQALDYALLQEKIPFIHWQSTAGALLWTPQQPQSPRKSMIYITSGKVTSSKVAWLPQGAPSKVINITNSRPVDIYR